jgi:hypothetical protein
MQSIIVGKRYCGPPNSANGGYVCGLVAKVIGGSGEVTLRAPPPLGQPLEVMRSADGSVELRNAQGLLATGRLARPDIGEVPVVSLAEAEDAVRRSPYGEQSNHSLPGCFVCGPARADGDGLRIFVGPLATSPSRQVDALAAAWEPRADLAGADGRINSEFVWSALDCPSGFASMSARHLGVSGTEPILLGRMAAQINERPKAGDRCVVVAWPTGRDRRKLFANSALLGADGERLAVAQATWVIVDREVLLSKGANDAHGAQSGR